jgi:hypothetical protein
MGVKAFYRSPRFRFTIFLFTQDDEIGLCGFYQLFYGMKVSYNFLHHHGKEAAESNGNSLRD